GLFNILQEGDVQIKGFPLRLPLDVLMAFTANPEDYTARGKIITPLKDRIGAEVRTHYPARIQDGIRITRQEAWTDRCAALPVRISGFVEEIVEAIAFQGRKDGRIDQRSGVSQRLPISCLECSASNAERRAVQHGEKEAVVRVADIYAALPSITGKLELEYEGELRGAEAIAHELIQAAVLQAFVKRFGKQQFDQIVQWFDLGGELAVSDQTSADEFCSKVSSIQGLEKPLKKLGIRPKSSPPQKAAALEFVLEGLHSQKRISRNALRGYYREAPEPQRDLLETLREGGQRPFN
ncbi:MAG: magnesium chelatase, partial [Acidobacteriota bacterium]